MPSTDTEARAKGKKSKTSKQIEKVLMDEVKPDEMDDNMDLFNLNGNADIEDRELQEGEDIFLYGAEYLFKKEKLFPKFTIKKYGQLLTTKTHPYSLEKLQKEFGGGSYTIFCKKPNGQIFKQQSIEIADPPNMDDEKSDDLMPHVTEVTKPTQPSMMEMLTFLKTFNQDAEVKAREAREAASVNSTQTMGLITTMMQSMIQMQSQASQQSQNLFMEMNKLHSQSMEKMSENMNRVFEKINDQIHSLSSKKEEITPLKLLELMQRSEEKALKQQETVMKMVEERAEALRPEPEEDESLMKSVIKGFLPVVAQAVNQAKAQGALPNPGVDPVMAQRQREYELHQARNRQIAEENARVAKSTPRPPGVNRTAPQNETRPVSTATAGNSNPQTPKTTGETVGPSNQSRNKSNEAGTKVESRELKEHMIGLVLQEIADGVMSASSPADTAVKVKQKLEASKVQVGQFTRIISLDDIKAIKTEYNLPDNLLPWLTELYNVLKGLQTNANLESKTETPARVTTGEPAKDSTIQAI